jgi:hypothetical protein
VTPKPPPGDHRAPTLALVAQNVATERAPNRDGRAHRTAHFAHAELTLTRSLICASSPVASRTPTEHSVLPDEKRIATPLPAPEVANAARQQLV